MQNANFKQISDPRAWSLVRMGRVTRHGAESAGFCCKLTSNPILVTALIESLAWT